MGVINGDIIEPLPVLNPSRGPMFLLSHLIRTSLTHSADAGVRESGVERSGGK